MAALPPRLAPSPSRLAPSLLHSTPRSSPRVAWCLRAVGERRGDHCSLRVRVLLRRPSDDDAATCLRRRNRSRTTSAMRITSLCDRQREPCCCGGSCRCRCGVNEEACRRRCAAIRHRRVRGGRSAASAAISQSRCGRCGCSDCRRCCDCRWCCVCRQIQALRCCFPQRRRWTTRPARGSPR